MQVGGQTQPRLQLSFSWHPAPGLEKDVASHQPREGQEAVTDQCQGGTRGSDLISAREGQEAVT